MRNTGFLLLLALVWGSFGCASGRERMYTGPDRPADELALVEVNTFAQTDKLRWVITDVRLADGPSSRRTFEIPAGDYTLQVEWRIYDSTEGGLTKALLVPFADNAKRIDEGVESIPFTAEAGRLYRLRWAARSDASLAGEPRDMTLKLFSAGMLPRLASDAAAGTAADTVTDTEG